MTDLICRKTMMRCQTPGMCAPYGGCRAEVAILADKVLVPRELLERLLEDLDAHSYGFEGQEELRTLIHP
ncbi:hypothetical protein CJU07_10615 [Pseudomonas aeruginosa]|uniref:hypothetical protein n=1 Tax=Pseudomonas aeruginosa TaxID=287 RepID=UPI00070D32DB|nr:hypothetical protein [Pseudomonas aeruginosa]PBW56427.1 hypothetical protein CJU07_10615 [Pseudomonas aeruginosa]